MLYVYTGMTSKLLGTGDSGGLKQEKVKAAASNVRSPRMNVLNKRLIKITLPPNSSIP